MPKSNIQPKKFEKILNKDENELTAKDKLRLKKE